MMMTVDAAAEIELSAEKARGVVLAAQGVGRPVSNAARDLYTIYKAATT